MYRTVGAYRFARYAALAAAAIALLGAIAGRLMGQGAWEALGTGWGAASAIIAMLFGLGQWPPFFAWACRATPLGRVFPPIGGVWQMELASNWDAIAERSGLEKRNPRPLQGTATITARLFAVGMKFETDDRYTNSRTVSAQVISDPDHGDLHLAYIYKAETPNPVDSDSGGHHGAGYLDYHPAPNGGDTFRGYYWTNRNWRKGLNTAGTAKLQRQAT
jgi:hypothetical protein